MKYLIRFSLMLLCLSPFYFTGPAGAQATPAPKPGIANRLDIMLVLDNSGSMMKNDPKFLTPEVVTNFLGGLAEGATLGMIIFDQEARLLEPIKALTNSVEKAKFLKSLERVNYKGRYSDSPAAIERALYELKTNGRPDAARIIILLTDGIVDTGDPAKDLEKERWLKEDLTLECKKEKIRIFGIAFTDKADFSLIQTLAFKTGGEYYRTFQASEIQGVFTKINDAISKPMPQPASAPVAAPPEIPTAEPVAAEAAGTSPRPAEALSPKAEPAPVPPKAENRIFAYILAGAALFLGAVIFVIVLARRSKTTSPADLLSGLSGHALKKKAFMPRAELIDVKNITSQETIKIDKKIFTIGRDAKNAVTISKDTVSSFHAAIEYRDGFFYLEDQRSKNKTFLNGKEVSPHNPLKLKSGDVISFNIFKFIFLLPDLIPAGKTVMDFGGESELTRTRDLTEKIPASPGKDSGLPQAMLIDIKNVTGRKTIMLDKTITSIGRGVHNDVDIPKTSISGSHATIEYKNGNFFLEDQRSKNTTRLNGTAVEPFSPQKIKSGDEITFDIHKFIFLLEHQTPTGDTEESL
ncbi:MAG: FHA domain-containing protein [Desulfobacterales bacterium]|nr:FHA domain-containing protein [Desulfobacterales bacterium]